MARPDIPGLATLARLYGVQAAFYNVNGCRQWASPDAVLRVLRALGAPVESPADVPDAVRERRRELWTCGAEPVTVAWRGEPASVDLRLPTREAEGPVRCHLALEGGERRHWSCEAHELSVTESAVVEGVDSKPLRLPLPFNLPLGYHRLTVEWKGNQFESFIISAPLKAYAPDQDRSWGVFLPLYALRTKRDWGVSDLTDLQSLLHWVSGLGGNIVATLPLLAAFPDEPSPYAPASRLFWNELYLDISRVPDLERCPSAQAIMGSPEFQREAERLRSQRLVDYRHVMGLKRRILEELAQCFFAEPSWRHTDFGRFVEANPLVEDYARFRAAGERQGVPWPRWPRPLRDGVVQPETCDEEVQRYHLYVQWLAHKQMEALSRTAKSTRTSLYLDLPLGAHPAGYDAWRERSLFAQDVSAGAPPDTFFARGQNWGFHPANPEEQRRQAYSHFIACLRHHLRHAGILRIDHVMGLHRLYWLPEGMDAREGVYVRYPAEELYAILSLESQRHRSVIVGEDLGTVPLYVRKSMRRHGLQRSHVVQIDETASPDRPLTPVPAACVASLNTHDTPMFAAYWRGHDEKMRRAVVAFLKRHRFLKQAEADAHAALQACLAYLSASSARTVLISLEDLWLETDPQNVPGTTDQHPNWRRKARHTLEEFRDMPEVVDTLRAVDRLRKDKVGHVVSK